MNPYREREMNLSEMGFASYESYLSSNLWYRIRESVFFAAKRTCAACGGRATEVHHRNYSLTALRGESLLMLVPLCGNCHDEIEHDGGKKCSLERANAKLDERLSARTPAKPCEVPARDPWLCPCGKPKKRKGHFCRSCNRMSHGARFKLWRKLHEERQARLQDSATGKTPRETQRESLARPEDRETNSAAIQPGRSGDGRGLCHAE